MYRPYQFVGQDRLHEVLGKDVLGWNALPRAPRHRDQLWCFRHRGQLRRDLEGIVT